jgi:hypothetical protein
MLMQPWNPELIKRRSSLHEPLTPSMRTKLLLVQAAQP